jgi:hypothetical protein
LLSPRLCVLVERILFEPWEAPFLREKPREGLFMFVRPSGPPCQFVIKSFQFSHRVWSQSLMADTELQTQLEAKSESGQVLERHGGRQTSSRSVRGRGSSWEPGPLIKVNGEKNVFRVMIVIFISVILSAVFSASTKSEINFECRRKIPIVLFWFDFEVPKFQISACRRATKLIRTAKRSAWSVLFNGSHCKSPRLILLIDRA